MEDIKTAMSFQCEYLAVSFPKNATDMEMARQLAYVAGEATKGVAQIALAAPCAVSMGILTCDTMEQALERAGVKAGNKGAEAAAAAIEQANVLKALAPAKGKGRGAQF